MDKRTILLPKDLKGYVDAKVASGEYADASDVVRHGIRLLMEDEANRLEWLRVAIAEGDAAICAGKTFSSAEVRERLALHRASVAGPHRNTDGDSVS